MSFKFKKFTDVGATFSPYATVRQRTGQIGFNAGAINRFNIRDYSYVVLYFDEEERAVGIELTNEKTEGAIGIKQGKSNTYIAAKNFLDRWGIDYDSSHRHKIHVDKESGLLYFVLDDLEEQPTEEQEGANEVTEDPC